MEVPAHAYQCDIVTDEAAFAGLENAWNALYGVVQDAYLSDSFDWARLSWELVCRPRGRELFCLVVRRGSQTVAIWPLVLSRRGMWRIASPLDSETSEYCPFLIDPAADLEQVWRAFRDRLSGCGRVDALCLDFVREERPLGRWLAGQAGSVKTLSLPTSQLCGADNADWDGYLAQQSRGLPAALRRDWRKLAATGEVRFEDVTDRGERAAIWSWMLANKRDWMVRRGRTNDWFISESYARFASASLDWFGAGGGRRIFALKVDGVVIAADLCSVDRVRLEAFVTTYDEGYTAFSPGKLLLQETARWAFERGLICDLRVGHDSYKRRWANQFGQVSFFTLPMTPAGRLVAPYDFARSWARRRMPRSLRAPVAAALRRWSGRGGA
ncbi:MAG TPA: GNAT family N-acetyltransferase [Phenylobacterium sp.]|nr:GNAT family N-acetyltransferase [Phenylobacterium sp.]